MASFPWSKTRSAVPQSTLIELQLSTTSSDFLPSAGLRPSHIEAPEYVNVENVSPKMLRRCPSAPANPTPEYHPVNDTNLDLTLGLERIVPVYAPPWAEPLPVTTVIPTKEHAVAILREFLADDRFAGATWYTDGSLLSGLAGGSAVLVVDGKVLERILIPLGDGQVAEGEIEGLLRATERAIASGATHILIVSDSQAGLKAVLSTAPRAGQFRAILYDKLIRLAMDKSPGLRITNLWTPAHIGTVGNEFADDAAKAATRLPPPASIPVDYLGTAA
ncbi:ribonuclease H-like domain-containing protein [Mycena crocata]|nr:ribonuclease H-like domain-containing protein [Mycena crocata]